MTSCSPSAPSVSSKTSAKSREGRLAVPAKITSSMPPPRSDLALPSPITQRMASSRLDLPQPLGPTTPVSPGSISSSAGSTKLLKPVSRNFLIRIAPRPPDPSASADGLREQRIQLLPLRYGLLLAVDHEGRRAADAVFLIFGLPGGELIDRLLVGEACLGLCLGQTART